MSVPNFDTEFLSETQDTDTRIRIYATPERPESISLMFDTINPVGTVTVSLEIDDAKKLATRIWSAVKLAKGELQLKDPRHAN